MQHRSFSVVIHLAANGSVDKENFKQQIELTFSNKSYIIASSDYSSYVEYCVDCINDRMIAIIVINAKGKSSFKVDKDNLSKDTSNCSIYMKSHHGRSLNLRRYLSEFFANDIKNNVRNPINQLCKLNSS